MRRRAVRRPGRSQRSTSGFTGAFALLFAVFDLAEVAHQVTVSRTALVGIAAAVALLHLASSALAFAGLRSREG